MSPRTTAPARRRARSFRLGSQQEEQRSAWLPAVVAFVVAAVVFGFGGYLVGTPPEEEQMAADIRAADAARDQEQIVSLTTLARDTRDALAPVVEGLGAATGTAAEVATWKQTVATAAKSFDDPPSGSTATNVARGSLAAAVDQLAVAVDTYALGAGGHALADRQLDLAVTTWSVGATQLDQINVDAGHGHQHVFLTGDEHSGAFTPDDAPEGTGHR
jgi:hypothetical protein